MSVGVTMLSPIQLCKGMTMILILPDLVAADENLLSIEGFAVNKLYDLVEGPALGTNVISYEAHWLQSLAEPELALFKFAFSPFDPDAPRTLFVKNKGQRDPLPYYRIQRSCTTLDDDRMGFRITIDGRETFVDCKKTSKVFSEEFKQIPLQTHTELVRYISSRDDIRVFGVHNPEDLRTSHRNHYQSLIEQRVPLVEHVMFLGASWKAIQSICEFGFDPAQAILKSDPKKVSCDETSGKHLPKFKGKEEKGTYRFMLQLRVICRQGDIDEGTFDSAFGMAYPQHLLVWRKDEDADSKSAKTSGDVAADAKAGAEVPVEPSLGTVVARMNREGHNSLRGGLVHQKNDEDSTPEVRQGADWRSSCRKAWESLCLSKVCMSPFEVTCSCPR